MSSASCLAFNCGSKYGEEGVTFHKFPLSEPHVVAKWLSAIQKPDLKPTEHNFICSKHFEDSLFSDKNGYRFLNDDAVPTKFYVLPPPKALFPKDWPFKIFGVKELKTENAKGYAIEAKIAVNDENQFVEWLKQHEDLSKVSYKLVQKFPRVSKHLALKCQFRCRYSTTTDNNTLVLCPAKFVVRIKAAIHWSAIHRPDNVDPLLYPCTLTLYHIHNHDVGSNILVDSENTVLRDVSEDVKLIFTEMFKGMYSPELALSMHKSKLQEECPDEFENILRDKNIFPDMDWVKRFYEELTETLGEMTPEKMLSSLEAEVNAINGEKGKAKLHKIGSDVVVALCTSLMARAHCLKSAGEVVFINNLGFFEKCKWYVYVFMAYSCAEGLPLGVLLTTSESDSVLVPGLQLLIDLLPQKAFAEYNKIGPEAFSVDNNEAIQKSLKVVFPQSTVVLSSFMMLKAFWRWLWNTESKIEEQDRCELFSVVHNVMKTKHADEFSNNYNHALQNETAKKYPEFQAYFKEICSLSERWAVCFENKIFDKDNVSAVELAGYVLKDNMHLIEAYNISQLFRFLACDMESYYERKIIHSINNTLEKFFRFSYKQELRAVDNFDVEVLPTMQCKVTQKNGISCYVAMDLCVCSCSLGINGARCKHQYAVFKSKKADMSSNIPTDIIKNELYWIGTNGSSSLLRKVDPEAGGSDIPMEVGDDMEYNPHQEFPPKSAKSKATKKATTARDEAKTILDRVVKDILQKYDKRPSDYHEAIVCLAVNYQSLGNDEAIVGALNNFGHG